MHLAAALGVPTVAIFGSTEPALTAPVGSVHRVVREKVDCSPLLPPRMPRRLPLHAPDRARAHHPRVGGAPPRGRDRKFMKAILTHPGSAHKDDFLACCLLIARHGLPVWRRDPLPQDLDDPEILVVDVGGEHDPARGNFDHHQFPSDHPPVCSLSLVLQDLGLYEDARAFCEWLEPAECGSTRGAPSPPPTGSGSSDPSSTASIPPSTSPSAPLRPETRARARRSGLGGHAHGRRGPLHVSAHPARADRLRRGKRHHPRARRRRRADPRALHAAHRPMPGRPVLRPRPLPRPPRRETVDGLIYPDRAAPGFGLSRHEDCERLDFTRIAGRRTSLRPCPRFCRQNERGPTSPGSPNSSSAPGSEALFRLRMPRPCVPPVPCKAPPAP